MRNRFRKSQPTCKLNLLLVTSNVIPASMKTKATQERGTGRRGFRVWLQGLWKDDSWMRRANTG